MNRLRLSGNRCQCTSCGEFFNSVSAFDRHRSGDCLDSGRRSCLSAVALIALGWSRNSAGFWIERAMARGAATSLASARSNSSPGCLALPHPQVAVSPTVEASA